MSARGQGGPTGLEDLIALILRAAHGDQDSLDDCTLRFELLRCQGTFSRFPEPLLVTLLRLMDDSRFLKSEDSWRVLKLLENAWDLLAADQRDRLLIAIERAYPRMGHWMGAFFLSELLGSMYCDDSALEVLDRLYTQCPSPLREFIPHALGHIARGAATVRVRECAKERLRQIASAGTGRVREEALCELAGLGEAK